ncbi:uncharacterized protein LOC135568580 [Oncorhynchus nerka]|uniref:uncharacterized protein LOC135568580 n=1 Tax=Oncorhynchus nerka TaxID=8023 RepID=UPI0031B879E6
MRILLIVILLSFMTGCLSSFKVTGYSGGTVIISCHYSTEDRSREKYFCLEQNRLRCEDQIRTGLRNTWVHSGRFSLYDNTGGNYFKVIIRQLTRQDERTYWCGVDKPTIPDSYTKVELDVKKDDCCEKSVTETAFLGGEATIRCNYPEDHEDNIKYFCKVDSESDCENKISDTYHEKPRRYSLSKRRRERFSTVTISDLTEDDTGTYWCGVETSRTEQRYITLITQVKLLVITAPTTMSTTTTTTTALQASATITFISQSSSSSSSSSSSPSSTSSSSSSSSLNGKSVKKTFVTMTAYTGQTQTTGPMGLPITAYTGQTQTTGPMGLPITAYTGQTQTTGPMGLPMTAYTGQTQTTGPMGLPMTAYTGQTQTTGPMGLPMTAYTGQTQTTGPMGLPMTAYTGQTQTTGPMGLP